MEDSPAKPVREPADSESGKKAGAAHDHRSRRCPMLGHSVSFSYCRAPARERPCRKVLDCWWETFDVREFIRSSHGEEGLAEITAPPKERILSLVELIEQARKGKEGE